MSPYFLSRLAFQVEPETGVLMPGPVPGDCHSCSRSKTCDQPCKLLAEKSLHRGLRVVDEAPIALARQRVDVSLAQEAHVGPLFERVHAGRIVGALAGPLVELDGTHVLLHAVHALHFLVAAQLLGDHRYGHSRRNQHQRDHYHGEDQHEAGLAVGLRSGLLDMWLFFHSSNVHPSHGW